MLMGMLSSVLLPLSSAIFYLVAFVFLLASGRGVFPQYLFASAVSVFALCLMLKARREGGARRKMTRGEGEKVHTLQL